MRLLPICSTRKTFLRSNPWYMHGSYGEWGPAYESEAISDVFFMAIAAARSQVIAVTPYFIPSRDIIQALRSAALRGVDVKLLVPRENNHISAGYASRAFYEELLQAGVRIFEREPPFMHAKALVVDDIFLVYRHRQHGCQELPAGLREQYRGVRYRICRQAQLDHNPGSPAKYGSKMGLMDQQAAESARP